MNAQLVTSATGKYASTCRLCGKRSKEAPALDLPIVGDPGKRINDLMTTLTKHVGKHHQQEFQEGAALLDETLSFLVLTAFDHEDPSIGPRIEAIRARIFAKVRKNTMQDAMIEHVVASLGLDPDDACKVNEAMKGLRDACCEFGQFAPAHTPPSVITPV
jgi:hypothetical protein